MRLLSQSFNSLYFAKHFFKNQQLLSLVPLWWFLFLQSLLSSSLSWSQIIPYFLLFCLLNTVPPLKLFHTSDPMTIDNPGFRLESLRPWFSTLSECNFQEGYFLFDKTLNSYTILPAALKASQ